MEHENTTCSKTLCSFFFLSRRQITSLIFNVSAVVEKKGRRKKKAKEIYKTGWLILGVHTFIEHEGGSSENEQGQCLSRAVILITGSRDEEIVRHGSP